MVYQFRIILDAEDDVIRDIAIKSNSTFEDFHHSIIKSFGFNGSEIATFYVSDDNWNQGETISLLEMNTNDLIMSNIKLEEIFNKNNKMLYVYDFLKLWTFFIELNKKIEVDDKNNNPKLIFSHGVLPENPPEKKFIRDKTKNLDFENDLFDDPNIDSFDENYY